MRFYGLLEGVRKVTDPPTFSEMLSVGCCFWWAASLLLYRDQFAQNHSLQTMAALAPQWAWAAVAFILAVSRTLRFFFPWHEPARKTLALATVFWWAFIAISIAITNPFAAGVGIYASMAALQSASLTHRPKRAYETRTSNIPPRDDISSALAD